MSEKLGRWRRTPGTATAFLAAATGVLGVTAAATYEDPRPVTAAVQEQTGTNKTEEQVLTLSREAGGIASRGCLPEEFAVEASACGDQEVTASSPNNLLAWAVPWPETVDGPATLEGYHEHTHEPPADPVPPVPTETIPEEAPPPPPPPPEPAPAPPPAAPSERGVWDKLARCESGGDWHINTGNGYYGGLQFSLESWRAAGGTGYPHEHSREVQIEMAERLQDMQGWGAWPVCARRLGLI